MTDQYEPPKTTITLPIGSMIIINEGEYSDKQAHGPFRTLKPFNGDRLIREYLAQWKPEPWEDIDDPDCDAFLKWLESSGFIER
ncbi:hypothetical protein, partial [Acidiphilium sp.]|uniref:hypothetical protein n=1 Tax=Acidiphilium sp. TaxID=527 RepID=UPI003D005F4E